VVTPKQILKESFAFSQMMDMFFTVLGNWWIEGGASAHVACWAPVGKKVWEEPQQVDGAPPWRVPEGEQRRRQKSCVCVWFLSSHQP